MIICHPLKLIFLKTKKTGGTSFEVALSKYCTPECIITPISPEDEAVRKALNFAGPQNYLLTHRLGVTEPNRVNFNLLGDFGNHSQLWQFRRDLTRAMYDSYCKLAIHRDPADVLVSQYYFKMRHRPVDQRKPFADWYLSNKDKVIQNYEIAPIKGELQCDVAFNYANLADEIESCGILPDNFLSLFQGLRLKGQHRDSNSFDTDQFYRQHGVDPSELRELLSNYL